PADHEEGHGHEGADAQRFRPALAAGGDDGRENAARRADHEGRRGDEDTPATENEGDRKGNRKRGSDQQQQAQHALTPQSASGGAARPARWFSYAAQLSMTALRGTLKPADVMPALVAGLPRLESLAMPKAWMAGTGPAMTRETLHAAPRIPALW